MTVRVRVEATDCTCASGGYMIVCVLVEAT